MRLVSWNVGGLLDKMKERKGSIFQKVLAQVDSDIICLQETKLQSNNLEIKFPGYEVYWNCAERNVMKGQSGTAILSRIHPIRVLPDIETEISRTDGRVLTAEFADFFVVCYYSDYYPNAEKYGISRDEGRRNWLEYQQAIRQFIGELDKKKPVILCGDFNVAHKKIDTVTNSSPGVSKVERGELNKLLDMGFVDSFRLLHPNEQGKYTWWSNRSDKISGKKMKKLNRGRRLDYFFVSDKVQNRIQNAEILNFDLIEYDHCPIALSINIQ